MYESKIEHISEALNNSLKDIETERKHPGQLKGLSTGLKNLDKIFGGLHSGELILVGGLEKSSFILNIALNVAKAKEGVLFLSLKLGLKSYAKGILALESNINFYNPSKLSDKQMEIIKKVALKNKNLPMYFQYDCSNIENLKSTLTEFNKKQKLSLLVIDDLQSLCAFEEDCSSVVRELANLARKLKIVILITSKISGNVIEKPVLSDIPNGEKIVEHISKILFIHREVYYLLNNKPMKKKNETSTHFNNRLKQWEKDKEEKEKQAEIIVAKNKFGATGTVYMSFDPENGFFKDKE